MIRSLVIDDEQAARRRLTRLLSEHSSVVTVIGEARDGLEALEKISAERPDLIFLDVEMPGLSGFQVLQSLPQDIPQPLVVFTTGYDKHALAAFEANAVAYLLKPVEPERLAHVIDRAIRIHSFQPQRAAEQQAISTVIEAAPLSLKQLVGRKLSRFFILSHQDIFFFRVDDGVVKAHTATDAYSVNYQINHLDCSLPGETFFRAHRSAIVNLAKVKEVQPYGRTSFILLMSDRAQTEIKVSERQAAVLRRRLPGL